MTVTAPHSRQGSAGSEARHPGVLEGVRGREGGGRDEIMPVWLLADGGALVHPIPSLHLQVWITVLNGLKEGDPYEVLHSPHYVTLRPQQYEELFGIIDDILTAPDRRAFLVGTHQRTCSSRWHASIDLGYVRLHPEPGGRTTHYIGSGVPGPPVSTTHPWHPKQWL